MSQSTPIPPNPTPVPGWKGGFSTSNPDFAYPKADLSSLPLLDNMANIDRLERQVRILWPEFSWQYRPGDPETRCYQMFAPDISRIGYDATGRVWSIICPQQGAASPLLGSLNVEVTVTGQRGWVDEAAPQRDYDLLAADLNVVGKVWFGPSALKKKTVQFVKAVCDRSGRPFPFDKSHAIEITLHRVGQPGVPTLRARSGVDSSFENPSFALHADKAWGVANLAVEIGPLATTHDPFVDEFNAVVMGIFNLAKGNILATGNILTWNVWFDAPTLVDRTEWKNHAEYWRESIDADHGSPAGDGTAPRLFDGTPFKPLGRLEQEIEMLNAWLTRHVGLTLPAELIPPNAAAAAGLAGRARDIFSSHVRPPTPKP